MGTRAEWDALTIRLRAASDPFESPDLATLWTLACEEGPRMLVRFRQSGRLDDERIADLIRDLLVGQLPLLLKADNPQAYFKQALHNAACSWPRKKGSSVVSESTLDGAEAALETKTPAPDHAFLIDARDFLSTLSQREYDVLLGVAHDEDREDLARGLGISRANLDQIVSRLRKRFRGDGP